MTRFIRAACACAFVAIAGAARADAQAHPIRYGVTAGVSLPTGDLGNAVNSGFHVGGLIDITPANMPTVQWRFEAAYTKFAGDNTGVDIRELSATGNAVLEKKGTSSPTPFLIGGLGLYSKKADAPAAVSHTDFGINFGVGARIELSGFDTFAEIRFHNVFTDGSSTRWIPITFGILF
jgi:hypothetical protein